MIENVIFTKLEEISFPFKRTGDHFIVTKCLNPEHNDKHPSFSINTETGFGKCFSCGFIVNEEYWLKDKLDEETIEKIKRANLYKKLNKTKEKEIKVPIFLPPKNANVKEGWRGLNKETIDKLGLYITKVGKYKDRVIFPYYSEKVELQGFNTRSILNNEELSKTGEPKYKYSFGLKPNEVIYPLFKTNYTDYVVICEGIMDAISMYQNNIPAIMNFGVNNTIKDTKIKYFLKKGVETIYIALDNDEAGRKGLSNYLKDKTLRKYFDVKPGWLCPALKDFYMSGLKDYNDFLILSK